MLGNVLESDQAVEVSFLVVRTLLQLRKMQSTRKELSAKLDALERKVVKHNQAITGLIDAIRQLTKSPNSSSRPIGITADFGKQRNK